MRFAFGLGWTELGTMSVAERQVLTEWLGEWWPAVVPNPDASPWRDKPRTVDGESFADRGDVDAYGDVAVVDTRGGG